MEKLKLLIESAQWAEAQSRILTIASSTDNYTTFSRLCRLREGIKKAGVLENERTQVRIALMGSATTDLLSDPLSLALETLGFNCQIHRSEYNDFAREMLDERSATVAFQPNIAVVVNTPLNQPIWPQAGDGPKLVESLAEKVCKQWLSLCETLHANVGCDVILNNFHQLGAKTLGNLGAKLPWDENNFLRRVNLHLGDRAPNFVHINDVAGLAARFGTDRWFDTRYWFHAKQPVSFECLVPYVRNTAHIIGALLGNTAKCVILDLDNTLWEGVIGDDGVQGIKIGEGSATGEAFKAFQQFLKKLQRRGVMLAVCSKNEKTTAMIPFREHTEMVLRLEDFVAFEANWKPKPLNIQEIAKKLNIGLDSLVFVDDNPVERDLVRRALPSVKVVELGQDPADYPRLLEDSGWFEIAAISAEDEKRTYQYRDNAQRQELQTTFANYEDYLEELQQLAVIRPFESKHLDRITQLINKTNQFNLTTRRMNGSEVAAIMKNQKDLTLYVRLSDRFGDNGLISVLWGRRKKNEVVIEIWLMSCRVFNRGVEQLLCNVLVDSARRLGVEYLRGSYLPTDRNQLVKDHYKLLGFDQTNEQDDGTTFWQLKLERYAPFHTKIELVEDYRK